MRVDTSGCLVRLVRPGAPWVSLGSIGFVWFVRIRPCGRWVRSGSSCSSGCALGVAGFLLVRLVSSGVPWVSLSSYGLIWIHPRGCWIRLGSLACALAVALAVAWIFRVCLVRVGAHQGLLGSFRFVWFLWVSPGCFRVRFGSSGTSGCALGVAGFVRVRLVRPSRAWGSLVSFRFLWFAGSVRLGLGCLCVPSGSSGSFGIALGVAEFVLVYLVR